MPRTSWFRSVVLSTSSPLYTFDLSCRLPSNLSPFPSLSQYGSVPQADKCILRARSHGSMSRTWHRLFKNIDGMLLHEALGWQSVLLHTSINSMLKNCFKRYTFKYMLLLLFFSTKIICNCKITSMNALHLGRKCKITPWAVRKTNGD